MNHTKKTHSTLVAIAFIAFTGCLAETSIEGPPDESCAIPPVSAVDACDMNGGRLITEGDRIGSNEELREIEYQTGGDCGEGRATAMCAFATEICLESGAVEDPCGVEGLEALDSALCDVIEDRPLPLDPTQITETDGIDDETDQDGEDRPTQTPADDPGILCGDSSGPDGEPEVGCVEPPEYEVICRRITIDVGCGATREILCQVPKTERPCPDIYAPVCGVDGVTYPNECHAGSMPIESDGECESRDCPLIYAPVCGVDGITYDNDCLSEGVEILHDGECEGTTTGPVHCIESGLLEEDSVFEVRAEFLQPESGAWMDEEGNAHTVEQAVRTQITVIYTLIGAHGSSLRETEGPDAQEIVIAPNHLEILHLPNFDDESESESIFDVSWLDYFRTNELSDGTTVHIDGHAEGVFTSRLALSVDGQLCFIEDSAELYLDQPLPEPPPVD